MVGIDLSGRTAVVTGASSGMGAETAKVMARCGARIVAVGRDRERLDATVDAINAAGGEATGIQTDLAEDACHAEIVAHATEGGAGIDILALAAGHFVNTPLGETPIEQFDELWRVHVRSPFLLLQAALDHLNDGASVLFFSSTVATSGFAPYAPYTAVKGAIESMARSLAVELAPRVRVNVMAPGFTATPMVGRQVDAWPELEGAIVQRTPMGFMGGPEHVAHLAAYLSSDLGAYVDGARMVVDGGWTAQGWQA